MPHRHLHPPLPDEAEDVPALVGMKHDLVLAEAAGLGHGGDRREFTVVQLGKQRKLPEESRIHEWRDSIGCADALEGI